MKTIICAVCGKAVETQARTPKYCPECRIKVEKEREHARWGKGKGNTARTEKGIWYSLETLGTPENVAICLDCKLDECRHLSKYCKRKGRK